MIVADASAVLSALLNDGVAREQLGTEAVHVPHLVDSEVAHGLRRRAAAGDMSAPAARHALDVWQRMGIARYPMVGFLGRVWELRDNVTAYDGAYVALAESLGCALLTADTRLSRATGPRCAITVVPR